MRTINTKNLKPITVYCDAAFARRLERAARCDGRKIGPMLRRLAEEGLAVRESQLVAR